MNNFSVRQECYLSLNGNETPTFTCDMPSCLSDGLFDKALGISGLYMNNSNIPVFVPELATSDTLNYSPGATTTNNKLNGTPGLNTTDYFIVVRNAANSVACCSYVVWKQTRNISPPSSIPDSNSIFTTPYYHCFDFTDFMEQVETALRLGIDNVFSLGVDLVSLELDSETNTFNLSISNDLPLAGISSFSIEFSPKLIQLFPFQSSQTAFRTYRIKWQQLPVQLASFSCYSATAPVYDSIFPFDLILLNCNLPMIPVEFIENTQSAIPLRRNVFFKFRKANAGLSIYNFFEANNNYLFDKLHRFTQGEPASRKLSITLILRTRKGKNYLEWSFPTNCELALDMNVFTI